MVRGLLWAGFHAGLLWLLYVGWIDRHEGHTTPKLGVGYWLGIVGGTCMLALLVYPLRKRLPSLRFLGSVPFWFRAHMALGLLGPTLILLHCNFQPGSMNSSVALYAMLIVAGSGIVGRFLYGRVNAQFVRARLATGRILDASGATILSAHDGGAVRVSTSSAEALARLTARAGARQASLMRAVLTRVSVGGESRRLERRLRLEVRRLPADAAARSSRSALRRQRRDAIRSLRTHLRTVREVASLSIYERLFALWHLLHLPLFIMLVAAVVAHIVAVHLY